MDYQCSRSLGKILDLLGENGEVDLADLAAKVASAFGPLQEASIVYLRQCNGRIAPGTLVRFLHDSIVHDSVVRDMLTIGHIAKLLSRMDVLRETSNPGIVGLPNALFDKYSQQERKEFFERGGLFLMDGELLAVPTVKRMLERETSTGAAD